MPLQPYSKPPLYDSGQRDSGDSLYLPRPPKNIKQKLHNAEVIFLSEILTL
jgi:hypothetical protein